MKLRLEGYRKSVRRQEIEEFMQSKRLQLMESTGPIEDRMIDEDVLTNLHAQIKPAQLRMLSQLAQNQEGLVKLREAQIIGRLVPYLEEPYRNTEEQGIASYILSNMYFILDEQPDPPLTEIIYKLLSQGSKEAVENMLSLLNYTLFAFPDWRIRITSKYQLPVILSQLFGRFQHCSVSYYTLLAEAIFYTVHDAPLHPSMLSLFDPLCRMIKQHPTNSSSTMLKKTFSAIIDLSATFPKQRCQFVKKGVLKDCLRVVSSYPSRRIVTQFLQLCLDTVEIVEPRQFDEVMWPALRQLIISEYKVGAESKIYTEELLRLMSYKLVRCAMDSSVLDPSQFQQDLVFKHYAEQMRNSDDSELLQELVMIAFELNLQGNSRDTKQLLESLMPRIRRLAAQNFQLEAMLFQLDGIKPITTFEVQL